MTKGLKSMARNPAFEKKYLIEHKESPEIKRKARSLLNTALASNKVIKDNFCWWCLTTKKKVFAHHEDYSKPLDIVWLCGRCHYYSRYDWAGPNWTYFPWNKRSTKPDAHMIKWRAS